MRTIKGDLIKLAKQGHFDVIIHGCNCFCIMGNGIALQIRREFPQACLIDQQTIKGDKSKLGTINYYFDERYNVFVVNAYTQHRYGSGLQCDYVAIRSCMKRIKEEFTGKRIGLPLIGCGLGGGDWNIVSKIINEELLNEDITIVEFIK